jgi:hypothetical protein
MLAGRAQPFAAQTGLRQEIALCQDTEHADETLTKGGRACLSFHLDKDRFSVNPTLPA